MFPQDLDTRHGPEEISFAPEGIMRGGDRPIDGDLHPVTAPGGGQKGGHLIRDHGAIAQDVESHAVSHDPFDEFLQILPTKSLSSRKRQIHDGTAIQFLEEPEPFLCGEILTHIPCAGEMAAVLAAEVATVRDGQIHGFWSIH